MLCHFTSYSNATFEIEALNSEITDGEGNTYCDKYYLTVNGFNQDGYLVTTSEEISIDFSYIENFAFKYVGIDSQTNGAILFVLTTLQHGETATEKEHNYGMATAIVEVFYDIDEGKISFSNKRPNKQNNNPLKPQ